MVIIPDLMGGFILKLNFKTNNRNKIKKTRGAAIFDAVNVVFMTAVSICMLYPVLYVIFASFSDPIQYTKHSGLLLKPLEMTHNYPFCWRLLV